MVLCVTVPAFCLYIPKVLSLLLSLLLSLYFLHQVEPVVDVRCQEVAEGRGFVRDVPEADSGLSGCSVLLWRARRNLWFVCAEGLCVLGRPGWTGLTFSLCFQGLQPLYVPTLLTEEVLNFSPISLESLARPLSDIQQNSNYTFSESGIQVYLENSPQNVGDLFTRHSLAGWIIEICPLWLCLCLEELVGQRRLLCLGKLLLVCHHPLWFLKSCRHWFMQLLEQTWPPL